jgi:hypothetical protein
MSAMTAGSPGFSGPGATALTVMWRARSSPASTRVIASTAELPRCLPVDEERAPHVGPLQGIEPIEVMVGHRTEDDLAGRVDQDVDTPEGLGRLCEHPFDVELVGDVGADRERGPACGEDLLDDAVGRVLVPDVADDNGVAPVRELAHDLPADTPRAAGDDRYTLRAGEVIVVVRDQAVTLGCERRPSHQGDALAASLVVGSRAEWRSGAPRVPGPDQRAADAGPAFGECPQG